MDYKMPYYMAYPMPLQYDDERMERRDLDYMKSMYPDVAKRLLPYVEDECDRMEYEGSMMYDEYPDQLQLRLMCKRVYDRVKDRDDLQMPVMMEENMLPDDRGRNRISGNTNMRNGTMQDDNMQNGMTRDDNMQNGMMRDDNVRNGMTRDNDMRNGMAQDDDMRNGMMRDDAMRNGMMRDDAMRNGMMRDDAMRNGMMRDDNIRNRMMQDGSAPDDTMQELLEIQQYGMRRRPRKNDWLQDLIQIMMFQEIYKRRCDHRRCRSRYYMGGR